MTNSIANAVSDAGGFHQDSNTDSHDIDHGVTPTRQIGEGEEKDFVQAGEQQDKDGNAATNGKLHTGTGSKSPTPFWVHNDFAWKSGVNQATGETYWNLSPLADKVNLVISYAPSVLDDAYGALSDDDKALAFELGASIKDTSALATTIDSWLERTATYAYMRDCAKNAASAVRWTLAQEEAAGRDAHDKAAEHEIRARESGRKAAMLRLALIDAEPTLKINFKGGAWDLFKSEAYRHAKSFMNPDEENAAKSAKTDATKTSGFTLRAAS